MVLKAFHPSIAMLESYDMEISLIKDENDALAEHDVQAMAFDDHVAHIAEHKVPMASVAARKGPSVPRRIAHIQQHLDFLAGNSQHGPINPILATIGNQPTLPPGTPDAILLPKPAQMPPNGPQMPAKPPLPPQMGKPPMPQPKPVGARLPAGPALPPKPIPAPGVMQ